MEEKCAVCEKKDLVTAEEVRTGYCNDCIYSPTTKQEDTWIERLYAFWLYNFGREPFPPLEKLMASEITKARIEVLEEVAQEIEKSLPRDTSPGWTEDEIATERAVEIIRARTLQQQKVPSPKD